MAQPQTAPPQGSTPPATDAVVRLQDVRQHYGKQQALAGITLDIPAGCMVGLLGPDGVGKSSLLSLVSGARAVQHGHIEVLGGDISDKRHREATCPRIAYMPQGLGKNLYPTLSVEENLQFFARCSATTRPSGAGASTTSPAPPGCRSSWSGPPASSRAA